MGIFISKPKVDIEKFCQTYYDSQMFQNGQNILDYAFQQLTSTYSSFSKVDRILFDNEMTAMHLELFGLAFFQRFFTNINHTGQQSIFTRNYLYDKNKPNIWEAIGNCNKIISKTATMRANGRPMTSETVLERITITVTNTNRASMWKRWITNNKIDLNKLTDQDEKNLECVARVCNRFGVDILDKQEIGNRQITSLFFTRLAGEELLKHNPEPSADFYLALASQAHSTYEFDHKTIKSIDLKFS